MDNVNLRRFTAHQLNQNAYLQFFCLPIVERKEVAPLTIRRNKLIGEESTLPRGWKISFEIYPVATVIGWSNVMHATIGGDFGKHGDRTPGIWFDSRSTKLMVATTINDNPNAIHATNTKLSLNKYSTIVVQQTQNQQNPKYYDFQVFVNGKREINVINKKPQVFHDVKYYASDPWYEPAKANVKNYKLEKFEGKYLTSTICR